MNKVNFQEFLHREIPLTKQMGLSIIQFEKDQITLSSPLKPNINDKGSVFGGSSSALQIIAAWSLIKLNCLKHHIQADIVIYKNETLWQKPLYDDILITSEFTSEVSFEELKQKIINHKKVTLKTLSKTLDRNKEVCSEMKALYVIIPK